MRASISALRRAPCVTVVVSLVTTTRPAVPSTSRPDLVELEADLGGDDLRRR